MHYSQFRQESWTWAYLLDLGLTCRGILSRGSCHSRLTTITVYSSQTWPCLVLNDDQGQRLRMVQVAWIPLPSTPFQEDFQAMKRSASMLVLAMIAASGSHARVTSSSEAIGPGYIFDCCILNQIELDSTAFLLAQGPRGPGNGPWDFRGPERPPYPRPQGPGPAGPPDFRYGLDPRPAPAPRPAPPDPGPAGIIPHVLPLLLPPPRP